MIDGLRVISAANCTSDVTCRDLMSCTHFSAAYMISDHHSTPNLTMGLTQCVNQEISSLLLEQWLSILTEVLVDSFC